MARHVNEYDAQLNFLAALVEAHTSIAGDILQLGDRTWALHGTIPLDGNVLVAEFETFEEARATLTQLAVS